MTGIISEPVTEKVSARGKSVQLTCVVDRFPDNVITWHKRSDEINSTSSKYKVKLLKVVLLFIFHQKQRVSLTYYCVSHRPLKESIV